MSDKEAQVGAVHRFKRPRKVEDANGRKVLPAPETIPVAPPTSPASAEEEAVRQHQAVVNGAAGLIIDEMSLRCQREEKRSLELRILNNALQNRITQLQAELAAYVDRYGPLTPSKKETKTQRKGR